jgi:protein required for attachment to host cells
MEQRTTAKQHAAQVFAQDITKQLQNELASYTSLVIAAAPGFLGLLRSELSDSIKAKVKLEIDKDLTGLNGARLEKRVNEDLKRRHLNKLK